MTNNKRGYTLPAVRNKQAPLPEIKKYGYFTLRKKKFDIAVKTIDKRDIFIQDHKKENPVASPGFLFPIIFLSLY